MVSHLHSSLSVHSPGVRATWRAGAIRHRLASWHTITSDRTILQWVSGYNIDFMAPPPSRSHAPSPNFTDKEVCFMGEEIERLQIHGVIESCTHETGEYVSPIFLRPKKNGQFRMILNLKDLNPFIEYHHFKMESLDTCLQLMTPGVYMASLDLSDAYYSVPVHKSSRKFLKFQFKGQLFQYCCLPNGLSSAPRVFTKLLKPVFAYLRQQGHVLSSYLDDSFALGLNPALCDKAVWATYNLLTDLGFHINTQKSVLVPCQILPHLGFILDSTSMLVSLSDRKMTAIKEACLHLKLTPRPTLRHLAQVIGKLVAAFPGETYGPLYYRELEKAKVQGLRHVGHGYHKKVTLPPGELQELNWWLAHADSCPRHILQPSPDITLQTDASLEGWGATIVAGHDRVPVQIDTTGGRWPHTFKDKHINVLELSAVLFGLKALCAKVHHLCVHVQIDNTTAVAYIKAMGGIHSEACNNVALEIWHWCKQRDIWLTASHIAGVDNSTADAQSRQFNDRTEWQLAKWAFDMCVDKWGSPTIDMFASQLNTQLPIFAAWKPDPQASYVDAFSISWHGKFIYCFPPFCLLSRVLCKIQLEGVKAIVVAPRWPTQPWFPVLQTMAREPPIAFPSDPDLLVLPGNPHMHHPMTKHLHLQAYLL